VTHTLLEVVQSVASSLNSDQVNSIGDTPESLQIAECVKTSYLNMLGRYDLPEHNQFINLLSPNNSSQPTLLMKPPGVNRIEWIQYYDSNVLDSASVQTSQYGAYSHDLNTDIVVTFPFTVTSTSSVNIGIGLQTFAVSSLTTGAVLGQGVQIFATTNSSAFMNGYIVAINSNVWTINVLEIAGTGTFNSWTIVGGGGPLQPPGYIDVEVADPHWFMNHIASFSLMDSTVGQYTLTIDQNTTGLPQEITIKYKNDSQPRVCCVIANNYIIFDSYDNTQDACLQPSKSLAYAWVMPPFVMSDTFVIPLDDQQYPMLLSEAKSLAWFELKQMPHPKAEQEVSRQLASLQKFKALAHKPSAFDYLPNFGRMPNTGGYAIFRAR
jgi:hypothetical protein